MAVQFNRQSYPLVPCEHCSAQVYSCDVDDHVANICRGARVPCCNWAQGCTVMTVRHQMHAHLTVCPASAVVCFECVSKYSKARESSTCIGDYRYVFRRDELGRHYQDVHDTLVSRQAQSCECPFRDVDECKEAELRLVPFGRNWTVRTFQDGVTAIAPLPSSNTAATATEESGRSASETGTGVEYDAAQFGDRPLLQRGLSKEDELSFYGYEREDIVGDTAEGGFRVPRQLSQTDELAMYGYDTNPVDRDDDCHIEAPHFTNCLLLDLPVELRLLVLACLDPYSLRQVSLTCTALRDLCMELVRTRGVLQLEWRKTDQGWRQVGERWHFSTFTTFVGKGNWKLVPDFLRMAGHTQHHYESRRQEMIMKSIELRKAMIC